MSELSNLISEPQFETPSRGANLGPPVILLHYRKQGSGHAFITSRVLLNETGWKLGEMAWEFPLKCNTVLVLPTRCELREK